MLEGQKHQASGKDQLLVKCKQAPAVTLCSSLDGSCSGASPSSFFMGRWLVYIEPWLSWNLLNPWQWSNTSLGNSGSLLVVLPAAARPLRFTYTLLLCPAVKGYSRANWCAWRSLVLLWEMEHFQRPNCSTIHLGFCLAPVSLGAPQRLKAGCRTHEENPWAASGCTFLFPVRAAAS